MSTINQPNYPVGSRLLVAWMIKESGLHQASTWGGLSTIPEARWIENDMLAEVTVEEYSPTGKYVLLATPERTPMGSDGWYPIERIVVKETLAPRSKQ